MRLSAMAKKLKTVPCVIADGFTAKFGLAPPARGRHVARAGGLAPGSAGRADCGLEYIV
jgi:hypothetical protein